MKSKEETIKEYLHKLIDDGFPLTQDNTLMFTDGFSRGIEFSSLSKWIDVNEKLPDDGDDVLAVRGSQLELCTFSDPTMVTDKETLWFNWDKAEWINNKYITHWMPIPSLPPQ